MSQFDNLLRYCEFMIELDEPERALLVLDNLPGRFRENPPERVRELRWHILASLITPHGYMAAGLDAEVKPEHSHKILESTLRGQLLLTEMKRLGGNVPFLLDIGPGEYNVPLGLGHLGFGFDYRDIGVDRYTRELAFSKFASHFTLEPKVGQTRIAIVWEIIEHMADPRELTQEVMRYCQGAPEYIHLSTPCFTFDEGPKDWRRPNGLPHRRTYSPREFLFEAQRIFPGYVWFFHEGQPMSLRGVRSDTVETEEKALAIERGGRDGT